MTNKESIEILQYMRHDVLANSDRDIALVKAIEALSVDFSTLKPSYGDVVVAKIDVDSYTADDIKQISSAISKGIGDTPVIFVPKDVNFTVESTSEVISEVISELQNIINKLRGGSD